MMKKDRILYKNKETENLFKELFEKNDSVTVFITNKISSRRMGGQNYIIQNFDIFPKTLAPYFNFDTRLRDIVLKNYIKNLYLGNVFYNEVVFDKVEIFDPCNFSVYYKVNNQVYNIDFGKDIEKYADIMKSKTFNITLPKEIAIPIKLLGKCETCVLNKECQSKRKNKLIFKKKGVCFNYEQAI